MNNNNSNPAFCTNCSAGLSGEAYCPHCGQRTDTHVLTFFELIGEVVGDLFNLDSRLWRTLAPLMIRPGFLTLEYLRGRRAYYLPPFRVYLVLSIVFFLLLSIFDSNVEPAARDSQALDESTQTDALGSSVPAQVPAAISTGNAEGQDEATGGRDQERCQIDILNRDSSWSLMSRYVCLQALNNFEKFGTTLVDSIPVMMLAGFPLVAAMMLVLYPFSGRLYAEHIIFLLHVHAFFFLVSILVETFSLLLSSLALIGGLLSWLQIGLLLYVPVYLFLAMKKVYGQGALMTLAKLLVLGMGYLLCVSLSIMGGLLYVAYTI